MIEFNATILKFDKKGEKTGWTYIEVSSALAQKLLPKNKKSFRVKGKLDEFSINQVALIPMGKGSFILPFNNSMRKGTSKNTGDQVSVKIEVDNSPVKLSEELLDCLNEEPKAFQHFNKLPPSHQKYYSRWIQSAKTYETRAKRIASAINALMKGYNYGEMLRDLKK